MLEANSYKNHKRFRFLSWLGFIVLIGALLSAGSLYLTVQNSTFDQKITKTSKDIAARTAISAKEAKKKQPVYITLPGATPIKAIVQDYSKPNSIWMVVSKTHLMSTNYVPVGLKIPDVATRTDKSDAERSIRADIEKPTKDMFIAANAAGYQLMIGSGYRSAAQQTIYYNSSVNAIGVAATNQVIAVPGTSEHQTGLAVDISTVSRNCYLDSCFGTTDDGQWLANNSYKYGFIMRYPNGKEQITGYQYEPWHFRYVGIDLATALHQSGLTLDEALPYLQKVNETLRKNGAI